VVAGNFVRGQGEFSRALRTLAFARAPEALSWFTFLPGIGALLAIASPLMVLLASWLALQKALHISRWRALLVPVISLPIIIIALAATGVIWNGLELTIETVSSQLGMEPANWFGP
jgi:hypothetical protein